MTGSTRSAPRLTAFAVLIAITLASCGDGAPPPTGDDPFGSATTAFLAAEEDVIAFRHDIHRHPELSREERRTAGKVADQLEKLGFGVRTNVGGFGVVGVLEGAGGGRTVAFRADMDAVAGEALDPVPYASQIDGVHHVCGHDVHTAVGIGLAHAFAAIRDDLPGNVMLIFQPAEEAATGAEAMLADGLFSVTAPDSILALHTAPLPVGQFAAMPGGMMAGRALVEVRLSGDGDIEAASAAVRRILEEEVPTLTGDAMFAPAAPDFISVELFPATDPSVVRGFVISAGIERRAAVEEKLRSALAQISIENVTTEIAYEQAMEGVNNDPAVLTLASEAIEQAAPALSVIDLESVLPMFSEDFGSFQRTVPGAMYFLGVNNPETGTVGMPHSPDYVADDKAINAGVTAMTAAMLALMEME